MAIKALRATEEIRVAHGFVKIKDIQRTLRSRNPGVYPDEYLPEIAFIGRSNVGKSSLINSLLARKKVAATSRTPGKTRAIDWFRIDRIGAVDCFFVDLPGYGFAKVPKKVREEVWARLIDTYLGSDRPLVLALQLLDMASASWVTLEMMGRVLDRARAKLAAEAEAGRVRFHHGSIEELPLASVTMSGGNAYWVYTPVIVQWDVDW